MGASLWLDEVLYYNYERFPFSRSIELGRPGSFWPKLVGPYLYCDVQRAVHVAFDAVGLHFPAHPELYLRLPSVAWFVASVVLLYALARWSGTDRLWAAGVALAYGSTPAFLFYAFEARVYSFAALLVIGFVGLAFHILQTPATPRLRVALLAAVAGLVVTWSHLWDVCLLAGLGICLPYVVWSRTDGWRRSLALAAAIAAGVLLAFVQRAYIVSVAVPGQTGIPLFEPQPVRQLVFSTVYGPFLGLLRGDPEYVLGVLLVLALFRIPSRAARCLPAAVAIGLAISIALMARYGFGISPRHQTPLYAGIFATLALMRGGLVSKALLLNLIGINLVLMPATAGRIAAKGNARQIAAVIDSGERFRRFPVVVQHSYSLGYPDPLHTFALTLYLDAAHNDAPILELPTHRDVRNVLVDREYFINGARNLELFSGSPVDAWSSFLRGLASGGLWFVSPAGPRNVVQRRSYEAALKASGFTRVRALDREFEGYPTTELSLWRRTADAR